MSPPPRLARFSRSSALSQAEARTEDGMSGELVDLTAAPAVSHLAPDDDLPLDFGPSRDGLLKRLLAFADALAALLAAGSLALAVDQPATTAFWAATSLPLWLILAQLHGLYERDERVLYHLTADEVPAIAAWAATGTAGLAAVLTLSPAPMPGLGPLVLAAAIALVAGACLRAGARSLWRATTLPEGVLIVGSGRLARATQRKFELFPDMHANTVRMIDEVSLDHLRDAPARVLSSREPDGPAVERVILASETIHEPLIAELVMACRRRGLKLSVVPPVRGMFGTATRLSHVADLPVVEYNTWEVARSTLFLKRVLDLSLGVPLLILALPVLAVIAAAIRVDSPGPAFFIQRRAGIGGSSFVMLKFRTMVFDAERRIEEIGVDFEILSQEEARRARAGGLPPMLKRPTDPRLTAVGKRLRRLSLDELPQLLNVVIGDMSLVGPRPEVVDAALLYGTEEQFRLSVKPGLTGPMQVYGRGDIHWDERLAVEREYVENLTLGRDLRIIARTAAVVLRGRGAY